MRALLALLFLALPLAGCAERPPDFTWDPGGGLRVPLWAVGDTWNYTIEDETGSRLGWVNYTVEAIEPVAGVTDRAYRVRVAHHDPRLPSIGAPKDTTVRIVFYDAATLNLVVMGCGLHRKGGPCRDPELDFPLWDNKTWTSNSTGDVIFHSMNRARLQGNGSALVRIEREAPGSGGETRVDLFDLGVGFYRERRVPGGSYMAPLEVWKLQDSAPLPAREPRAETPVWKQGWSWNYTIENTTGTRLGWILYTVEGVQPVPDVTANAYRVRTERFDFGDVDHDGTPNQTIVRTLLFDVATLNTVWNECGRPGGFGDCKGRIPDLDFPLWDNKTWNSTSGGDVIIGFTHRATYQDQDGAGLWRLERRTAREMQGWEPRIELFDPWTGFYRERHPPGEVWRLEEA